MREGLIFSCAILAILIATAGVALVPDLAQLAGPVVCSDGHLETTSRSYTRGPGRSGTRTSASCVDSAGKATPLNAGLVSLVLTFEFFLPLVVVAMAWLVRRERWRPGMVPEREPPSSSLDE